MYSEERFLARIIKEICEEEKIEYSFLSLYYVIQLKKDGKVRHLMANRFDLNGEASGGICCDKYATYCVLKSQDVPACEHMILFNPIKRSAYVPEEGNDAIIERALQTYGKIVVKPNDGNKGYNVFLCDKFEQAKEAVDKIFESTTSLSIGPYYDAKTEYRVYYLDGEVKLIYAKQKPYVVGDGVSSVETLISKEDFHSSMVLKQNMKFLDLDYIPKEGEKVFISWKFNLSGGALPKLVSKEDTIYKEIETLALRAGHAMNAKFVTIDILDTNQNGLMVLEINSGVSATLFTQNIENGYEMIKKIYKEAILKMCD